MNANKNKTEPQNNVIILNQIEQMLVSSMQEINNKDTVYQLIGNQNKMCGIKFLSHLSVPLDTKFLTFITVYSFTIFTTPIESRLSSEFKK